MRTVACRGREPQAYVLQFIGNADRAEDAAARAAAQWEAHPVEVWAVNYPAFGGSTGPTSLKGSAAAAETVPPKYQRRVAEAYAGEKRLVELAGANHNDMPEGQGEQDLKAGIDWLWARAIAGRASQPAAAPAATGRVVPGH